MKRIRYPLFRVHKVKANVEEEKLKGTDLNLAHGKENHGTEAARETRTAQMMFYLGRIKNVFMGNGELMSASGTDKSIRVHK